MLQRLGQQNQRRSGRATKINDLQCFVIESFSEPRNQPLGIGVQGNASRDHVVEHASNIFIELEFAHIGTVLTVDSVRLHDF